jgi:hypothetical protein
MIGFAADGERPENSVPAFGERIYKGDKTGSSGDQWN